MTWTTLSQLPAPSLVPQRQLDLDAAEDVPIERPEAEVATAGLADRVRVRIRTAFVEQYDEIAAKLLTQVCGFLVGAGDLDADFRTEAKRILLDVPEDGSDEGDESRDIGAARARAGRGGLTHSCLYRQP